MKINYGTIKSRKILAHIDAPPNQEKDADLSTKFEIDWDWDKISRLFDLNYGT